MQQSGCATSSCVNSSPMAMWTPEASKTCGLSTWPATPSATSSPGSGSGATHCGARAGRTTDLRGRDPALANLSPRQAKAAGLMTSGICGPISTISSSSAALQSSLESRLRARTQSLGSTLFTLTWKPWVTPSGRSRSRLRASAPRTSGTGCTGWASPKASGREDDLEKFRARQARTKERWPDKGMGVPLDIQAQLAVRHWPTPRAEDAESSGARLGRGIADTLTAVSRLAGWPTTTTRDYRCPNAKPWAERGGGKKGEQLNNAAAHLLDFGPETPSGSGAATGVGGRLNADFSRWLMGLPAAWQQVAPARSAVTATRSARRKRSNSSAQSSTAGQPDEELWA
jgi:hypothetical protein